MTILVYITGEPIIFNDRTELVQYAMREGFDVNEVLGLAQEVSLPEAKARVKSWEDGEPYVKPSAEAEAMDMRWQRIIDQSQGDQQARFGSIPQPVTESLRQSVTEPLRQPVTESLRQPVTESLRQSVTEPLRQPVTESLPQTNYINAERVPFYKDFDSAEDLYKHNLALQQQSDLAQLDSDIATESQRLSRQQAAQEQRAKLKEQNPAIEYQAALRELADLYPDGGPEYSEAYAELSDAYQTEVYGSPRSVDPGLGSPAYEAGKLASQVVGAPGKLVEGIPGVLGKVKDEIYNSKLIEDFGSGYSGEPAAPIVAEQPVAPVEVKVNDYGIDINDPNTPTFAEQTGELPPAQKRLSADAEQEIIDREIRGMRLGTIPQDIAPAIQDIAPAPRPTSEYETKGPIVIPEPKQQLGKLLPVAPARDFNDGTYVRDSQGELVRSGFDGYARTTNYDNPVKEAWEF
jgi:hypothetical protein